MSPAQPDSGCDLGQSQSKQCGQADDQAPGQCRANLPWATPPPTPALPAQGDSAHERNRQDSQISGKQGHQEAQPDASKLGLGDRQEPGRYHRADDECQGDANRDLHQADDPDLPWNCRALSPDRRDSLIDGFPSGYPDHDVLFLEPRRSACKLILPPGFLVLYASCGRWIRLRKLHDLQAWPPSRRKATALAHGGIPGS